MLSLLRSTKSGKPKAKRIPRDLGGNDDRVPLSLLPSSKSGKPKAKRIPRDLGRKDQRGPLSLLRSSKSGKPKAKRIQTDLGGNDERGPLSRGPDEGAEIESLLLVGFVSISEPSYGLLRSSKSGKT